MDKFAGAHGTEAAQYTQKAYSFKQIAFTSTIGADKKIPASENKTRPLT